MYLCPAAGVHDCDYPVEQPYVELALKVEDGVHRGARIDGDLIDDVVFCVVNVVLPPPVSLRDLIDVGGGRADVK